MYKVLDALTRLISPILAFTADEIWQSMPHDASADKENVVYNEMAAPVNPPVDEAFMERWDKIHQIRDDVKKALEIARTDKVIGAALDAKIELFCEGELYDFVKSVEGELKDVCIVSQAKVLGEGEGEFKGEAVPGLSVTVSHAEGQKCARCWSYTNTVGSSEKHPDVCSRCAEVLG